MKRLTWSDNITIVGWTNIHAYMSAEDMEWLLDREPNGWFSNTFYPGEGHAKGKWTYSWSTNVGMIENMKRGADYHPDGPFRRGFYFSFPEKSNQDLLEELEIMWGLGPRGGNNAISTNSK